MELKDLLTYGLFGFLMLFMMRFGGCCGGRKHKTQGQEDIQNERKSESAAEGSTTKKTSCH